MSNKSGSIRFHRPRATFSEDECRTGSDTERAERQPANRHRTYGCSLLLVINFEAPCY